MKQQGAPVGSGLAGRNDFLGKFFADEIENADPRPQRVLRSTGANRIKVLRYTVLPQVLLQYYAYVQYILERNIRTAMVLHTAMILGICLCL
jgi:ABC-type phosphate/phosphonate transport system permease subunit